MKEEEKKTFLVKPSKGVLCMGVLLLCLFLLLLLFLLPAFRIQKVTVLGCRVLHEQEIVETADIQLGAHIFSNISGSVSSIFSLRYGNIENTLRETFPFIEEVSVSISFPSGVEINVKERMRIGYIKMSDGYAIIDRNGYIVLLSGENPPADVPLFSGITISSAVLSEKIEMENEEQLDTCLAILNAVLLSDQDKKEEDDFFLMSAVRDIRYVDKGTSMISLSIPSREDPLVVRLGSLDDIEKDMQWLRYAILQNTFTDTNEKGVFDMSGEDYTFRKT